MKLEKLERVNAGNPRMNRPPIGPLWPPIGPLWYPIGGLREAEAETETEAEVIYKGIKKKRKKGGEGIFQNLIVPCVVGLLHHYRNVPVPVKENKNAV